MKRRGADSSSSTLLAMDGVRSIPSLPCPAQFMNTSSSAVDFRQAPVALLQRRASRMASCGRGKGGGWSTQPAGGSGQSPISEMHRWRHLIHIGPCVGFVETLVHVDAWLGT